MFDIEFSKQFVKQLDKLSENVVKRLYDDLRFISEDPLPKNPLVDVKKLQEKNDHYRLRIGKYRFLFIVMDERILVYFYDLGSRGDIYK